MDGGVRMPYYLSLRGAWKSKPTKVYRRGVDAQKAAVRIAAALGLHIGQIAIFQILKGDHGEQR